MIDYRERIEMDSAICHGRPVIRGLRYPVSLILDLLSAGMNESEILNDYPDLELADIRAAVAFAARVIEVKRIDIT